MAIPLLCSPIPQPYWYGIAGLLWEPSKPIPVSPLRFPLINHSQMVVFLAAGANKQEALSHIFAQDGDDLAYPARLIRPQGELWWLLDQQAAAGLGATVNEAVE